MEQPLGLQVSAEDRRVAMEAKRLDTDSVQEITEFISSAAATNSVGPDALVAIKAKVKDFHARFGARQTERLLFASYKELRRFRKEGQLQDEESRFRAEELVHLIFEGEIH